MINFIAKGVINNVYVNTNKIIRTVSIDSLFSKIRSSSELDNLILSADSVALLKNIQAVGTNSSLCCGKRIAYLLELNGKLKAAITNNSFAAAQLKIVIDTANAEISRLRGLIAVSNSAMELKILEKY